MKFKIVGRNGETKIKEFSSQYKRIYTASVSTMSGWNALA